MTPDPYTRLVSPLLPRACCAVVCSDGSVLQWGTAPSPSLADLSTVAAHLLGNVVSVTASDTAFSALRTAPPYIVAWSAPGEDGGTAPGTTSLMANSTSGLANFAGITAAGGVVAWGTPGVDAAPGISGAYGSLSNEAANVVAYRVGDTNLVSTWGDAGHGGAGLSAATGVAVVAASRGAFATLLWQAAELLHTYGNTAHGGDISTVASIVHIPFASSLRSTEGAFALTMMSPNPILSSLRVLAWGDKAAGGDSTTVDALFADAPKLAESYFITASQRAFAVISSAQRVVAWGDAAYGGDSSTVDTLLKVAVGGVVRIERSHRAFFALSASDKFIAAWGDKAYGGDATTVATVLAESAITKVAATEGAFAVLLADGRVVTWGSDAYGGDSGGVVFANVASVAAFGDGFVAHTTAGSAFAWGGGVNTDRTDIARCAASAWTAVPTAAPPTPSPTASPTAIPSTISPTDVPLTTTPVAPSTLVPRVTAVPTAVPTSSPTAVPTAVPTALPTLSPVSVSKEKVEEEEEEATDRQAVVEGVGSGAAVGALLSGGSAAAVAAMQAVVAGEPCFTEARHNRTLPMSLHPTQWELGGNPALGMVVANVTISASVALLCTAFVLLIQHTMRALGHTAGWSRDVAGTLHFPSVPLFVWHFLYQSLALGCCLLLTNENFSHTTSDGDSVKGYALFVGVVGTLLSVVTPFALFVFVRRVVPEKVVFAFDPLTVWHKGHLRHILLGRGEWLSTSVTVDHVARCGGVLKSFTAERPYWLAVEVGASLSLSLASAIHADTNTSCGHRKLASAAVFAVLLLLEAMCRPHYRARDTFIMLLAYFTQMAAMVLMACGYYRGVPETHAVFAVSGGMLYTAVIAVGIKGVLDLLAELYNLIKGRRERLQEELLGLGGEEKTTEEEDLADFEPLVEVNDVLSEAGAVHATTSGTFALPTTIGASSTRTPGSLATFAPLGTAGTMTGIGTGSELLLSRNAAPSLLHLASFGGVSGGVSGGGSGVPFADSFANLGGMRSGNASFLPTPHYTASTLRDPLVTQRVSSPEHSVRDGWSDSGSLYKKEGGAGTMRHPLLGEGGDGDEGQVPTSRVLLL